MDSEYKSDTVYLVEDVVLWAEGWKTSFVR